MQSFNERVNAFAENKKNLREVQLYAQFNKHVIYVFAGWMQYSSKSSKF